MTKATGAFQAVSLALVLAALQISAFDFQDALGQDTCPDIPVQKMLAGTQWYSDSNHSIVDPEKRREHEARIKPLHDLLQIVSNAADQAVNGKLATSAMICSKLILTAWANQGALLERPQSGAVLAEQTIGVVGLNITALKLKAAGSPLPAEVVTWIQSATTVIVETYLTGTQRGNLYVWSGVAAAANDLLTGERRFDGYHSNIWRSSIERIRTDGYVDDELARRGRSLIYHNYLRGALHLLRRLRQKFDLPVHKAQLAALSRLDAVVNSNACNPALIANLAGAVQTGLDNWATSIGSYFAEANRDPIWLKCAKTKEHFSSPGYGGRFDLTNQLLRSFEAQPLQPEPGRQYHE